MLLNKTTELAILSILYLAEKPAGYRINPAEVSERLGESPSYVSKVLRQLAMGGVVQSRRGMAGGYELVRAPSEISLLDIVEVTQGTIPANYCSEVEGTDVSKTCGYHQAMFDVRESTRSALKRWTLERILESPERTWTAKGCMMGRVRALSEE